MKKVVYELTFKSNANEQLSEIEKSLKVIDDLMKDAAKNDGVVDEEALKREAAQLEKLKNSLDKELAVKNKLIEQRKRETRGYADLQVSKLRIVELQRKESLSDKELIELNRHLINVRSSLTNKNKENANEYRRLTVEIQKNEKAIRSNDAEVGRHQRNVGNYIDGINGKILDLVKGVGVLTIAMKALDFGKDSFLMAAQLEGVQAAFDKLNKPELLDELRNATRGTVNDLELMKQAVKAANFGIALKDLPVYLEFAQKQAVRTGESIDNMVESLMEGLAKQSVERLDNVGIKISDINSNIEKTGNFTDAASLTIRNMLESMGDVPITTAQELDQMNTRIDNAKLETGKKIISIKNEMLQLTKDINEGLIETADDISDTGKRFGFEADNIIKGGEKLKSYLIIFKDAMSGIFDGIKNALKPVGESFTKMFDDVDKFLVKVGILKEKEKEVFEDGNVAKGMKEIDGNAKNVITYTDSLNKLINSYNKLKDSDKNELSTKFSELNTQFKLGQITASAFEKELRKLLATVNSGGSVTKNVASKTSDGGDASTSRILEDEIKAEILLRDQKFKYIQDLNEAEIIEYAEMNNKIYQMQKNALDQKLYLGKIKQVEYNESLMKITDEYIQKTSDLQSELVDDQYTKEIQNLLKLKNEKLKEIGETEQEKIKILTESLDIELQLLNIKRDKELELNELSIISEEEKRMNELDIKQRYDQLEIQLEQEKQNIIIDEQTKAADRKKKIEDSIWQGMTMASNLWAQAIEANYQADIRAAGDNQKKKDEINREYAKKRKQQAIIDVIISTAQGIAQIWASYAAVPIAAAALTVIAAGVGAFQIATISNQPDYASGGLLKGPLHSEGGIQYNGSEVEGNEFIMNRASTAKYLPLLNSLNNAGNSIGRTDSVDRVDVIDYERLARMINNKKVYVTTKDINESLDYDNELEIKNTL